MSINDIEKMKKLIAEKKKISSQQSYSGDKQNQIKSGYDKGFKSTKRGGALNK